MAPAVVCPVCNKNVTRSSGGVCCCICEEWYHLIKCSGLSDAAREVLIKKKSKVGWKCNGCSSFVAVDRDDAMDNLTKKLEDLINALPNTIRCEIDKCLPPIMKAVEANKKSCDENNAAVESKISAIVTENNRLRTQLARNDILVSGLPPTVKPSDMALKIPEALGMRLVSSDIDAAFWLGKNKKSLMIKFCSRAKRDEVMKKYMVRKNLKLSEVLPTNIEARIYLNDNLSPDILNLKKLCRSLVKEKKIKRFELISSAAKAVVFDANGTRKVCCYDDLLAIENEAENNFIRSQRGRRAVNSNMVQPSSDTPIFGTPTSAHVNAK